MNRKSKKIIVTGVTALALLGAFSVQIIKQEPAFQTPNTPSADSLTCEKTISSYARPKPTPLPKIHPVPKGQTLSAFAQGDSITPPVEPKPALVGEETAETDAPPNTSPTEIDFEPPKPSDRPAVSTPNEPPSDNPTTISIPPQTTATVTIAEPQMGDTRTVDGQKQIYILGFGWIADHGGGGKGIVVDGDGDINKMVGTMD